MTVGRPELEESVKRAVEAPQTIKGAGDDGERWCQAADIEIEAFRTWSSDFARQIEGHIRHSLAIQGLNNATASLIVMGFQIGWTAALLHGGLDDAEVPDAPD